jgi:organic hydroperoxide reductase OsmC/OhrA
MTEGTPSIHSPVPSTIGASFSIPPVESAVSLHPETFMPQNFPHHYVAELKSRGDGTATLSAAGRPNLVGGNPPEFDGPPDVWSPEHLLLSSLQLCYHGTISALNARAPIKLSDLKTRAEGQLEKTAAGIVFTKIKLHASATVGNAEVEKAKELLTKAKKYCIIANQLKTEPELELSIHGV